MSHHDMPAMPLNHQGSAPFGNYREVCDNCTEKEPIYKLRLHTISINFCSSNCAEQYVKRYMVPHEKVAVQR